MKKIIFAALLFVSMDAAAQIRLHANAGYVFDDKVDSYYSTDAYFNGKLKGGFQWGRESSSPLVEVEQAPYDIATKTPDPLAGPTELIGRIIEHGT